MDQADFQRWLDKTGRTILTNDFETYRLHIQLPFTLITSDGNTVVEDEPTLKELFDSYRAMFSDFGVTNMVRLCATVQPMETGLVRATYVTHVLKDGDPVFDPFFSDMTLVQDGATWRAVSITNNLTNKRWPVPLPRNGSAPAEPQT